MKRLIVTKITSRVAVLLCAWALLGQASFANSKGHSGDAEAGKGKSGLCAGCHGQDGNGIAPNFPNLSGQVPGYTAKQLAAFKSGDRADATMPAMVAALNEQDMLDLDAYYASLPAKVNEITEEQQKDALKGEKIYRSGIKEFSVSACMACHGPDGKGILPNYPKLSGQSVEYIEKQLRDFKTGTRKDDMMNPIAFPLTEAQMKQLALYISALY